MRLADPKPPFCAACYQHSTGDHIDFEAAYDGPVIEKDGLKIPVEDLILCASCVMRAAEILGMIMPEKEMAVADDAAWVIGELETEVKQKDRIISDLENTVEELVKNPIKRPAGRPHFRGVPKEVREQLEQRRKRSDAVKAGKAKKKEAETHAS